jgi:S1-C subfamily serine protease
MSKKLILGLAVAAVALGAGFAFSRPTDSPKLLTEEMQNMVMPEGGFRVGVILAEPDEKTTGALVERVLPNSPASKAGIQKGDIIRKINDVEVTSPRDVRNFFRDLEDAKAVSFELIRDGKPVNVTVTPEKRSRQWLRMPRKHLGVQLQELDKDLAAYFQTDPNSGILVTRVEEGSAADKAGMRSGDIITHIEGRKIQSAEDIRDAISDLKDDQTVEVTVLRHGQQQKFNIQPENVSFPEMSEMFRDLPHMMDRPEFKGEMDQLRQELDSMRDELSQLKKEKFESMRDEIQRELKKEMEQLRKDLKDRDKETN